MPTRRTTAYTNKYPAKTPHGGTAAETPMEDLPPFQPRLVFLVYTISGLWGRVLSARLGMREINIDSFWTLCTICCIHVELYRRDITDRWKKDFPSNQDGQLYIN